MRFPSNRRLLVYRRLRRRRRAVDGTRSIALPVFRRLQRDGCPDRCYKRCIHCPERSARHQAHDPPDKRILGKGIACFLALISALGVARPCCEKSSVRSSRVSAYFTSSASISRRTTALNVRFVRRRVFRTVTRTRAAYHPAIPRDRNDRARANFRHHPSSPARHGGFIIDRRPNH